MHQDDFDRCLEIYTTSFKALALESGIVSKEHVLNLLHRLLAADAPPPAEIPARLTLREEPNANVHRYDHLREARHAG